LLKNEAKKIDVMKAKWEANVKARACEIVQEKAMAKADAKAIAMVKADLKAIAKEIALDIVNIKADAKAIALAKADAKADAKAIAKLKAEWQAMFQEHGKIMEKVRADVNTKARAGIVGIDCDYPKGPVCVEALSGPQSGSCNSENTKRKLHEYNLFYREQYHLIKEVKPELKNHEIMVEIAKLWNLKKMLCINLAPPALNLSINYDVNPSNAVTPTNPFKSVNKDDFGGPSWWWINKGEEIMLNRR
jgi:hypothetical protein